MKKKGQAAMEFLMTYGWAIVVVLAAIGALAYFGVLSPAKLLPDKTNFPAPLQNVDASAVVDRAGNYVEVAFRNNKGVSITIPGVGDGTGTASDFSLTPTPGLICDTPTMKGTYQNAPLDNVTAIQNGEGFLLRWTCTNPATLKVGEKFKADVTFKFINVETTQILSEAGTVEGKYI